MGELLQNARDALRHAHCPYSNFRVGAAVLTVDGAVFRGVNVENASYGLAVCAERVALFTAVAAGYQGQLVALAVATEQLPKTPGAGMPCGACRQVMAELLPLSAPVAVARVGTFQVEALLPKPFVLPM